MQIISNMTDHFKTNDMLSHIILNAISSVNNSNKDEMIFDKYHKDGNLEIDFKINGVEVSIVPFSEHLEKELNRMIEQKAGELIVQNNLDKMSDLTIKMDVIISRANTLLKKAIKEKFPQYDENEDEE